jgi:hypothetical protein
VLTILGNRIVPGVLDHYLARTAYRSQQTDQPVAPDQPVNLWHPADGVEGRDYGARGSFTARSHAHSPQAWLARHRVIATAGLAAAAAGVAVWRRR